MCALDMHDTLCAQRELSGPLFGGLCTVHDSRGSWAGRPLKAVIVQMHAFHVGCPLGPSKDPGSADRCLGWASAAQDPAAGAAGATGATGQGAK